MAEIALMRETGIEAGLRQQLYNSFFKTHDWMRNRED
jgi:hypothetical protein